MSTQNTEFILVLLFINYCIIFHANNSKPTFSPPCSSSFWLLPIGMWTFLFWVKVISKTFRNGNLREETPRRRPCCFSLVQLGNCPEPLHAKGKALVAFIRMFPSAPYCFLSVLLFLSPVAFCCCSLAHNLFLCSSHSDYSWPCLPGVDPVMVLWYTVTMWHSHTLGIYSEILDPNL